MWTPDLRIHAPSLFLLVLAAVTLPAQQPPDSAPAARIIVTAEPQKHGVEPPKLAKNDVAVYQNDQRLQLAGWVPLRDIGMQLWMLIDDGTNSSLGIQLNDLKKFVRELPSSTQIGVGYLRNGTVETVQNLTTDHEAAAKSIRLPIGQPGVSASPYIALADLLHKWQPTESARQVLLISSGIDPYYGPGPQDPYLTQAIDAALRAGVIVNSIYFASAGHLGHSYWQIEWGQNDLSELDEQTGGEFYWEGTRNPVSFSPYLRDLSERFTRQYVATILANPQRKSGFERIKVRTEVRQVSLVAPARIYVPGAK